MPTDTNPYGGVFGGWLMSQMALAAGSLASRTAKGKAVVVAADELRFPGAPRVGDEISVFADLEKQGRTSMTIAVEAVARHRNSDDEFPVATGTFKFVALDDLPALGPARPRLQNGRVVLRTGSPTGALHTLTGWALARGGELEGLAVTRPSLEDVYLRLTGGGDR